MSLNSAAGVVAWHSFRANSVYDPDSTGVGHQPSYYDQCAAIYNHYRVINSRAKASFVNNGATATIACTVGIKLDDDGDVNTVLSSLLEEQVHLDHTIMRLQSLDSVPTSSMRYAESEFFGAKVPDTMSVFGSNPTEQAYYSVFVSPTDATTEIGPILVQVEIEYDVECSELKDLVPSNGVLAVTPQQGINRTKNVAPRRK